LLEEQPEPVVGDVPNGMTVHWRMPVEDAPVITTPVKSVPGGMNVVVFVLR
jgi:hypothetical protein